MNDEQFNTLAKGAYHAYGSVTNFKNYQGLPMPEWEQLTDKIREAWKAVAKYVYLITPPYEPDHK